MSHTAARPELIRRASQSEATPTALQWVCCAAAVGADPLAFQQRLYRVAYAMAVRSVAAAAATPRRDQPNWN